MLALVRRRPQAKQDFEPTYLPPPGAGRVRRVPVVPAVIIGVLVIVAIGADVLAPHPTTTGSLTDRLVPPMWADGGSSEYVLGTDGFGRDILSRIIAGARVSITLAVVTIAISVTIGTIIGLVAGYVGGRVDSVLMRITDAFLAFPLVLLAIVMAVAIGPSYVNVVLVLGALLWPGFARQIRSEMLTLRSREFVTLARAAGCSDLRIMVKHIVPNVMPALLVLTTYEVGHVILLESSLSFLGVGIPEPTPAWGNMVSSGRNYINTAWWLTVIPGLAILLTVLSINMLGDWVRDRLDPKLRQL